MLIVGNWKTYVDSAERAKKLYTAAARLTAKADIALAMPTPYLGLMKKGKVALGAQDVSDTTKVDTGEVTASMLASVGVTYVIVGHSERRARGESDERIVEKVRRALAAKLIPIVCVGETERDVDATYLTHVRRQIAAVYAPLSPKERSTIVLAYEPVWAIGKSAAESIQPTDLTEMVLYIRKVLADYLPGKAAQKALVLYGGSTEPANARALASGTGIDGFLVGHASVEPEQFAGIVKAVS